jgi:hypothetical protein
MAFAIADRVQETTVTQGTGTVLLDGAVVGYQSFAVIGNLNTTYYTIADQAGANWEVGVGTYYLANSSLARTTILSSSNSNAAVSFGVGTKAVFVTYPAEQAILADPSNITTITNFVSSNVLITGGTISGANFTGLGTMSTQNANAVAITGGTISGTGITSSNVTITGGTINSVAHTGGSINNMTIGATTANTGAFTTITTTSPINVVYGGTGSANLTAGYVVLGNNTSQVVLVAPGTSGNVLTSNGTAWISNVSSGGGSTGIGNSSILALNVNITANATINAGVNGFSVGPVNTANGVVVTITSGQRWVII